MSAASGEPRQGTRALVLGGGGPVGRAWEAGLVSGLAAHGAALSTADAIVGTSAGAIVGAQLALGLDLTVATPAPAQPATHPNASNAMGELIKLCARAQRASDHEPQRRTIGQFALTAQTPDEDQSMGRVAIFAGHAWPASLYVTAVNAQTGASVVWRRDSGVALDRAIAASCALPGVWPPISIGGQRFMDGGIRSMLNADLVPRHSAVIVVSCFPLALPEGFGNEDQHFLNAGLVAEIDTLRRSGTNVDVITPNHDFLALTDHGTRMLDTSLIAEAFQIGARQASNAINNLHTSWIHTYNAASRSDI
jgi:NTE family protein